MPIRLPSQARARAALTRQGVHRHSRDLLIALAAKLACLATSRAVCCADPIGAIGRRRQRADTPSLRWCGEPVPARHQAAET